MSVKAEKMILLTDVEGVLNPQKELISTMDTEEAGRAIANGIIQGGMIPKTNCCIEAVKNGVGKAHIIDGRKEHAILLEIFTDVGIGTEIVLDAENQ